MDPRIDEVIELWFGKGPLPSRAAQQRWFTRDPALDAAIRDRFGGLIELAASGQLDHWRGAARGELALLVLLDQLARNVYRDDPRAFANDPRALTIARELRDSGRARELPFHQRMVALLPFQHAEDRPTQAESVASYVTLLEQARAVGASADVLEALVMFVDFAQRHAAIIERFGRFPHRNLVLGRTSTAEELAFLEQPGSSF